MHKVKNIYFLLMKKRDDPRPRPKDPRDDPRQDTVPYY